MKDPGSPQYTLPETVGKTPHPPTQDTNGARATLDGRLQLDMYRSICDEGSRVTSVYTAGDCR